MLGLYQQTCQYVSSTHFLKSGQAFAFTAALTQKATQIGRLQWEASIAWFHHHHSPALTADRRRGCVLPATELRNIALPALAVAHPAYRAANRPSRPSRLAAMAVPPEPPWQVKALES